MWANEMGYARGLMSIIQPRDVPGAKYELLILPASRIQDLQLLVQSLVIHHLETSFAERQLPTPATLVHINAALPAQAPVQSAANPPNATPPASTNSPAPSSAPNQPVSVLTNQSPSITSVSNAPSSGITPFTNYAAVASSNLSPTTKPLLADQATKAPTPSGENLSSNRTISESITTARRDIAFQAPNYQRNTSAPFILGASNSTNTIQSQRQAPGTFSGSPNTADDATPADQQLPPEMARNSCQNFQNPISIKDSPFQAANTPVHSPILAATQENPAPSLLVPSATPQPNVFGQRTPDITRSAPNTASFATANSTASSPFTALNIPKARELSNFPSSANTPDFSKTSQTFPNLQSAAASIQPQSAAIAGLRSAPVPLGSATEILGNPANPTVSTPIPQAASNASSPALSPPRHEATTQQALPAYSVNTPSLSLNSKIESNNHQEDNSLLDDEDEDEDKQNDDKDEPGQD